MVEVVIKIPAIEKLIDYTASGVGAVAGPLLLPWRAYMEGKADRISTSSYASALPIIAQAQTDARKYLVAPDADVQGVVEFTGDNITQRIEFQERKRLANIRAVVESAAEELGDKEVTDHEPDPDWTARFFDCVQDVSSEDMQRLWAKVLSGEVESPGRTSLRTLDVLRNMTQRDAELFDEFAGYVIGGEFVFNHNHFVQRLGALRYECFLHLQDCGLLINEPQLAWTPNWKDREEVVLTYQNGALLVTRGESASDNLEVPVALLTSAGRELFRVVHGTVQMEYLQDFSTFLHRRKCQLSFGEGVETLPGGTAEYANRTLIEPRPIQPGMPAL